MSFFKSVVDAISNAFGGTKKPASITITEVTAKGKPKKKEAAHESAYNDEKSTLKGPAADKGSKKKGPAGPAVDAAKQRPAGPKSMTETRVAREPQEAREPKETREPRDSKKKVPVKKSPSETRAPKKIINDSPLIEDFVPEPWDAEKYVPQEAEGKTRFTDLDIVPSLLRGINDIGFQYATDIQAQILPHSLKGLDVTGRAQTGTGKTAAFLLTILQHLIKNHPKKSRKAGTPRALVMAPTRELVMQIKKDADELSKYCNARILAIFGGIDYQKQRGALEDDYVDIVIATPGRILDYYKQKIIRLDKVEILVLDEADRMLDMGFLPDMRRIIDATPPKSERQTMLFSATLPQEIMRLASMWTNNPIQVEIEPEQVTSADVEQVAYIVGNEDKFVLLFNLLTEMNVSRAIIFANRKDQVRRLTEQLEACEFSCGMLTGDVSQTKRIKTLENLRGGKINILVATDVAGRGIHVDGIEAVFNYTLPEDPDDYVHRIGRTGRAGAKGKSISFASEEDSYMLPSIEEHIKEPLKYIVPDESLMVPVPEKYQLKLKNIKRRKSVVKRTEKFSGDKRKPRKRV